ncbi:MAG: energy transducer TonB [Candidatus Sulfotelmatobacter sp.]
MPEAPVVLHATETRLPARDLQLLISSESRWDGFLHNLREMFRKPERGSALAAPGAFWPDVFVEKSLPWNSFLQSGAYHLLALALLWAGTHFLALQRHAERRSEFAHNDVVYYTPAEYLPPLDTRRSSASRAARADPEYSAQPIISLPREADNHSQTVVAPPNVRLRGEVALPNMVSALEKLPGSPAPIPPTPAVPAAEITRLAPRIERSVIAPPPSVYSEVHDKFQASSQTAVIAPPPSLQRDPASRLGDFNTARSTVIAPAPQLTLDSQSASRGPRSGTFRPSAVVISPPPAVGDSAGLGSGRRQIALNLHPAIGAPPAAPSGNRRGSFATTPEGHRGASGVAGGANGDAKENGTGSGEKENSALPSGLYVGKGAAAEKSSAYSVNPNLIANARPPRRPAHALQAEGDSKLSEEERAVFGGRKFYSLSLNMPNLNSAAGSWIIRFAALKPESNRGNAAPEELSAPSATRKVDPAYPLELMRQNVSGTVILYGVIRADGSVGNVRVLRSVDERLDRFAGAAIAKWQFQPATRNGTPVDVEATFWIPFRPVKAKPDF